MTKEEKERYILELNKKIEFASGLESLESNKAFKQFTDWMKERLEKIKTQMLTCKIEELESARESARGIAGVLKQIEIFKKEGNIAKNKLKKLIEEEKHNQFK